MMSCSLAAEAPEPILRPVWILSPFSLSPTSTCPPAPEGLRDVVLRLSGFRESPAANHIRAAVNSRLPFVP